MSRPLSSYMIWIKKVRKSVSDEFPSLNNKDIVRKLGELWRDASYDVQGKEQAINESIKARESYKVKGKGKGKQKGCEKKCEIVDESSDDVDLKSESKSEKKEAGRAVGGKSRKKKAGREVGGISVKNGVLVGGGKESKNTSVTIGGKEYECVTIAGSAMMLQPKLSLPHSIYESTTKFKA